MSTQQKNVKKRSFFGSVKFKLIMIIVLIMAVPLISTILISYFTSHSSAVDNMKEMNDEQVKLVNTNLNSIVNQNLQIMQTVANSVSARKLLKGELDADSVSAWLAATDEEAGDGNVLAIADANGMQVAKSKGDLVDVGDREYFQKAKETGKFFVSNQNISKSDGSRICTFCHPVFDDDGKTFLGTVQRNYKLDPLTEIVKSEMGDTRQDIFV